MTKRLFTLALALLTFASLASASDLEKGRALIDSGQPAEAEKLLARSWNEKSSPHEISYELGRATEEQAKFDKAETYYAAALKQAPRSSKYHTAMGRVLGMQAQSAGMLSKISLAKRAKEHLESAVSLDGDNLEAREALFQYYLVAPAVVGGSEAKALEQAAEIRKRNVAKGYRVFAMVHTRKKDYEAAEKVYREGMQKHPNDRDLAFAYGLFLQSRERWNDAFALFQKLVEQAPDMMKAWYQIGRTAALAGQRLPEGEAALKRYLAGKPASGDPSLAWAHTRLAQVYEKLNRKDLAKNHYSAALSLDPKIDVAREALKKL